MTPRYMVSGVALTQVKFARALAAAGHEVDLIIGRSDPGLKVPELEGVNLVVLGRRNVRAMLVPLWRYLRARKPEVVFTSEDHLNIIVLIGAILARSKAKISGSSRVTPFDTYSSVPLTKRWVLKQLMRALAWRADALTCVSSGMVDEYRQVFGPTRHTRVFNIVDDPASRAKMAEPLDDPWFADKEQPVIVAAGNLEPWKAFGDLVKAVAELHRRGRNVRLLILGDGSRRAELESLVAELNLGHAVRLPGNTDNPFKFFARADVFVLSSLVEGLGNVLVEAMLCGCTPVATDCPTGPRDILQGGRFGYLVPMRDPAGLADGIERALDHPTRKEQLEEAVRPFEATTILRRHFELLGLAEIK
ncbi:MAG: glycosyltransferase [Pseudomonadota bacterium]|nr:glycosyltransferase [Pseudomonadota bacterium]